MRSCRSGRWQRDTRCTVVRCVLRDRIVEVDAVHCGPTSLRRHERGVETGISEYPLRVSGFGQVPAGRAAGVAEFVMAGEHHQYRSHECPFETSRSSGCEGHPLHRRPVLSGVWDA